MDTKSRNIRYSAWFKLLAAIVAVSGVLTAARGLLRVSDFPAALQGGDYLSSETAGSMINPLCTAVQEIAFKLESETHINSPENKAKIYGERQAALEEENKASLDSIQSQYEEQIASARAGEDAAEVTRLQRERDGLIESEKQRQQNQLEDACRSELQSQLEEFHTERDVLARQKNDGFYYAAVNADGFVLTNVPAGEDYAAFFSALPARILSDSAGYQSSFRLGFSPSVPSGARLYLGMTQQRLDREAAAFRASRTQGLRGIYQEMGGALAYLAGLCWLLYAAGRKPRGGGEVALLPVDRLYLDIALALFLGLEALAVSGALVLGSVLLNQAQAVNTDLALLAGYALAAAAALLSLLFFTMAARRFKRGELLRHTLIYAVLSWLGRGVGAAGRSVRGALRRGPAAWRVVLAFLGYLVLSVLTIALFVVNGHGVMAFFLFLVVCAVQLGALVLLLGKVSSCAVVLDGARRIRSGDLGHRIPPTGGAMLSALADTINNIADGLKAAVDREVRAERMKAELVSNVSHDLKTPLTSIVTYVDLLKKEGPASENAPHYIDVLEQKAQRLKALTDDLVEASKAASGALPVKLEGIDLCALLHQGLGEYEEKIAASALTFRVNLLEGKLLVLADGRLLWRVIENLLSNVFKYAMAGSRVYLDVAAAGGSAALSVKNVSAYELNVRPEELTERFVRGDEARHSEGSGLGLSIAKSLMELQHGSLALEIDGDLFKAVVTLPLYQ